ncbi:hypothetical protein COLSTE_00837 [Collinsella stercoris DSM 13279]|uniref:Uncharacterized protein n=1 Tax=Collinsella stercoris DSM 13279 TaxID=445975 RepID=B6G9U6_9ACTN|nr:hypothetical protein COLSTE_00837 [Collinsella stercoris DSM 13279]
MPRVFLGRRCAREDVRSSNRGIVVALRIAASEAPVCCDNLPLLPWLHEMLGF